MPIFLVPAESRSTIGAKMYLSVIIAPIIAPIVFASTSWSELENVSPLAIWYPSETIATTVLTEKPIRPRCSDRYLSEAAAVTAPATMAPPPAWLNWLVKQVVAVAGEEHKMQQQIKIVMFATTAEIRCEPYR